MSAAEPFPPAAARPVKRAAYKDASDALSRELVLLQQALRDADFPVLAVFAGVDGAGKHEAINRLNRWLDPRYLHTLAWNGEPPPGPEMQRYWQALPPRGETGLVLAAAAGAGGRPR